MARRVLVAMLGVVVMLSASEARAEARSAPIHRGADVRFTMGGSAQESTLIAEGLGVRVSKRIGPQRARIRIEVPGDVIEIDAASGGVIRLLRRGSAVTMNMAARDQTAIAKARRITEGSAALKSFAGMVAALEGDSRAAAKSMLTSMALVQAIRGNDRDALAVARRIAGPARTGMTPVSFTAREETPIVCWAEYASTVSAYYWEYSQCLADYAWIPGMASVCAFEWLVKAELAWFWVIGCSGGVPV